MKINALQLYDRLVNQEKIIGETGEIIFTLKGITTHINDKNIVGNVLQDWLATWMDENDIDYEIASNTQEFPDFYLDTHDKTHGLLELKAFDASASANFDIANFEAYCNSLTTKPSRLDADYLIFSYSLSNAIITIKNVWLKKIWEISGPSEAYPVKVQQKRDVIYNLRPITWHNAESSRYKCFTNRDEFIEALYQTLYQYPKTSEEAKIWKQTVQSAMQSGGN